MRYISVAVIFLLSMGQAIAEIEIGVAGPLSGKYALFGNQVVLGATRAVEDLNAAGGLFGEPLAVTSVDDECGEETAKAVANQLVGKSVSVVIGHFCSAASMAAAPVYAKQKLVQLSPASPNPKYTLERPDPDGGTYRLFGHFDEQPRIAGSYLRANFNDQRVAFAHDGTAYGRKLADAARKEFRTLGGRERLKLEFSAGQVSYPGLITQLQSQRIDLLYLGAFETEAAIIAQQIAAAGLTTKIMGGDTLMSARFGDLAGAASEGTLLTFQPDLTGLPEAADFIAYLNEQEQPVDGYALYGYAAVQIFVQAAKSAGNLEFPALVDALNSAKFTSVIGDVKFDPFGNNSSPGYMVYQWQDNDVLPVTKQ